MSRRNRIKIDVRHVRIVDGYGLHEYRRVIPVRYRGRIGQAEFKRRFHARTDADLILEHARLSRMYSALLLGDGAGPDVVVFESVDHRPSDRDVSDPPVTLQDALDRYLIDKGGTRQQKNLIHGAGKVLNETLKGLDRFLIRDLTREHARLVRDRLSKRLRPDGLPVSPGTVRRQMGVIQAMINHALLELPGLDGVTNPFMRLPLPKVSGSIRKPMPDDVLDQVSGRLRKTNADLFRIWMLLAFTGCRLGEVTGLRKQDIRIDGPHPHLVIESHNGRRLKTDTSNRLVPLIGQGLITARQALDHAPDGSPYVFRRYVSPRGPDAASAALGKHVRAVTDDRGLVVHSLRHRMKDLMRIADVPDDVSRYVLGHAGDGIAESYGSHDARLVRAMVHMQRVWGC